ncbi:hypothetical protein P153DRAFT_130305 [Dothidotthia symphoricarpi CBS 119687]|uniref:Peptidase S28 n=1 Tax=Dothidotthia symphoricarpi CBS 119687 TaxID=1392245 RepID=A0A6A5ZXT6_9PLEO|nr:uncharacterized protein P153DRAFT_130305 [Dothidotthia symphoricarpi CBS 119687]KAF2124349.1 hypothetical protein P153DRAFT_130305 [Dothidotthia symphoricarpi CBS 119687]
MRSSTPIAAFALALLQGTTTALNQGIHRNLALMADMGLNPDGTPFHTPSSSSSSSAHLSSLRIGTTSPLPLAINTTEIITPEYVELPVNHFSKMGPAGSAGPSTFHNRFWVSERAYRPGGPVFIYDVGEANAEGNALFRLQNETSFFRQIVEQFGGIGVVWEHRFYGNSTPVPIDLDTPAEAFKYLTTEQSLADVDTFARQFKRKNINATLTPESTPFIFIGGSYPAMRAAFMREKYPDTIYASYASSAPVQASVDMSFYFDPVVRGLEHYGFGNCSADIKAAIKYMDKVMDGSRSGAADLKTRFLGKGADANSHATFADALTTPFYLWQSYGVEGGQLGLRRFCDFIETDPASNTTAPAEGWAKPKGAKFTVDRWASMPWFAGMVNAYMETDCSGKANVTGDCDLNRRFTDPASISWTWQYCTQWGFFQSANLGPNQVVSKYNSLTHQRDICHRQFPNATRSLLPEWPNTARTNAVLGGWNIRPSNTYWSGGEFDPWRTLSPLSAEIFAPKVHEFTEPPKCGQGQRRQDIFGYVMADAQHCYDFRTTFAGGAVSRGYFTRALTGWLGCFTSKGKGRRWDA